MSVVVSNLDRRVQALCEYAGHHLDRYGMTEHDPGADVCREESCSSAIYVGLIRASRLLVDARAELVCNCDIPGPCTCSVEAVRFELREALHKTNAELEALIRFDFPGHESEVYEILGCEVEW